MANTRAGNYQLEFKIAGFVSPIRDHTHSIYVAPVTSPVPGVAPDQVNIQLLGGGDNDLQSVADEYCSFFRKLYSATVNIENFTLWRYATEYQKDFITAGVAVPGNTGVFNTSVASQLTLTYRTGGGAVMKQVFVENNITSDAKSTLETDDTGNTQSRMASYILSQSGCAVGIDNTFPVAPLHEAHGQNERIWRQVYRG